MKSKKPDFNNMSPEELDEYVKNLPERIPPKWSSVGWLASCGVLAEFAFAMSVSKGTPSWLLLGAGIAALGGCGYLVYRILTFNPNK
jgi:hypothetical protein